MESGLEKERHVTFWEVFSEIPQEQRSNTLLGWVASRQKDGKEYVVSFQLRGPVQMPVGKVEFGNGVSLEPRPTVWSGGKELSEYEERRQLEDFEFWIDGEVTVKGPTAADILDAKHRVDRVLGVLSVFYDAPMQLVLRRETKVGAKVDKKEITLAQELVNAVDSLTDEKLREELCSALQWLKEGNNATNLLARLVMYWASLEQLAGIWQKRGNATYRDWIGRALKECFGDDEGKRIGEELLSKKLLLPYSRKRDMRCIRSGGAHGGLSPSTAQEAHAMEKALIQMHEVLNKLVCETASRKKSC